MRLTILAEVDHLGLGALANLTERLRKGPELAPRIHLHQGGPRAGARLLSIDSLTAHSERLASGPVHPLGRRATMTFDAKVE